MYNILIKYPLSILPVRHMTAKEIVKLSAMVWVQEMNKFI